MEYAINKLKRNSIILSSVFLILYILTIRLYFYFADLTPIGLTQQIIQNLVFLVPYTYIILGLFVYFRFYQLKVLQVSVAVILLLNILFRANLFTHLFESTGEKAIFTTAAIILLVATFIFLIFLFQSKTKDCPGIFSIRKYAISTVCFFALSTTAPFWAATDKAFATQQLVELTTAIPYIFIIEFALKLRLKE